MENYWKYFTKKKVLRNEILHIAGDICKNLYIVKQGCLRSYYLTKDGKDKTRYIAFEDSIITALSSFIFQEPSFEYIESLENSEVLFISHQNFFKLKDNDINFQLFYLNFIENAYQYQTKKIEERMTLTAKQRFEKLMNENPMYFQRLSNKIIASYLDITQETLSRIKVK